MQRKKYSFALIICLVLCFCTAITSACTKGDLSELYDDETSYTDAFTHFAAVGSVSIIEEKYIELSFMKLSGIREIKTISVSADTLFDVNTELSEGRLRIILVSGKNWYLLAEGNTDIQNFKPEIPEGKYKLRIVSDKAAATVKIKIK